MIRSARLLVLQTTRVGEKSIVLHTLSPEWGRRSFIVSAGKAMALYLPLNLLDAEVVENPKSDLWRIRAVSAVYPLAGLRGSVAKNAIGLFMSEVLFRLVREECCEPGLFEWCEKSVLTLDALQADYSNFHLRWLLELAGALGFSPTAEDLAPFAGDCYPALCRMLRLDFAGCMLLPLSGSERSRIAAVLLDYIFYHSDCRPEIRSLPVLHDLFA